MASTEPGGSRMPLTPSSTTSGSPPARVADHRSAAGHRLERRQAERLALGGQHEEVGLLEQLGHRVEPAQEAHVVRDAQLAGFLLGVVPLGAVADHEQRGGQGLADPCEDADHVLAPA